MIGELGRSYRDGEVVCRQGDPGDCLFVIQEGELEVVREEEGQETLLRVAGKDELLGEMAIFYRQARSATVRARGPARVLTLDKRNFLKRIDEDPSLAFRIVETMSRRVRELSTQVVELRRALAARGG
ncbi:MAG: cyclic nucleotide-binding domain-containing protein [Deltaproteobacteria bacterium]|nr:cyclic nucleotide-binding domain-containing protein [Deltaproteobacteria bacterium]